MSGFGIEFLDAVDDRKRSALEDIFEEEPVSLEVFIKDKKFLHSDWDLSAIQTDLVQHIERIYLPGIYPQMAEEFGGYWALTKNIPMKNLISAEWGKGCVSADTLVYNPETGHWRRIDEIAGEHWVAGTRQMNADGDTNHEHGQPYNEEQKAVLMRAASKPFVRGTGRMLRVTTTTGSVIDVYEGHLFASKRGVNWGAEWTAAGSLKSGNLVAVPAYLPGPGDAINLTMELLDDAVALALDGGIPTVVETAFASSVMAFLGRMEGKRLTHEVAQFVKRLHLRLGRVASLVQFGDLWEVSVPYRVQIGPMDNEIAWDMVKTVEDLGEGEYWDMNVPVLGTYVANGFLNSNSGKDHSVRVAALRVAYLLLCLKSPQKYFGMPEHDSIHMLNIAVNAAQAKRAFFKPLTQAVRRKGGWFEDRAEAKMDSIQFAKNLEAISGHSDAESQEGLNLILGVADEIDAFKSASEMVGHGNRAREASTSAESILNMIKSSASTRFPANYKRVAISYPRYLGSTMQKLTEEAKEDVKKYPKDSIYYASGPYATWDVNPLRSKSEFDADYRKDPVEAAAKYECKPFRASAPYFRDPQIFHQSIDDAQSQPIEVEFTLKRTVSDITGLPVESWEPLYTINDDFYPRQGAAYAIHADLAITGDRAGVSMSHVERWAEFTTIAEDEEGNVLSQEEMRPIVRNDFTFAFTADIGSKPAREIQIRWVRELVFKLLNDGFHIASVTYDGYQSTDSMQILESHGIETDRVSTDRDVSIWRTLKDVASDGRLRMPYQQLLIDELEALNSVNGKVDHPPAGSKDLADAFACSIVGALLVGGEESEDRAIVSSEETVFESGLFGDLPLGMTHGGHQMPLMMRDY